MSYRCKHGIVIQQDYSECPKCADESINRELQLTDEDRAERARIYREYREREKAREGEKLSKKS